MLGAIWYPYVTQVTYRLKFVIHTDSTNVMYNEFTFNTKINAI